MISKKIFLILFIILPLFANSQDTIKAKKNISQYNYDRLSFKISSLIIMGEIPMIIEYRPNKSIGNEFSISYTYLNPIIGDFIHFEKLFCNGYKVYYGTRFYFTINKAKTSWFFINPGIFYKQVWINNIEHTDWKYGVGSDSRLVYLYNENKRIIGGKLLFGFAKTKRKSTFELYFGLGLRNIFDNIKYTKFQSYHDYWDNFNKNDLPNTTSDNYDSPSFYLGFNFSFSLLKRKK